MIEALDIGYITATLLVLGFFALAALLTWVSIYSDAYEPGILVLVLSAGLWFMWWRFDDVIVYMMALTATIFAAALLIRARFFDNQ